MTHRADHIADILRSLIEMYPERANDGDWLAAEASEEFGIDPKDAKRVHAKRFLITDPC